MGRRKRGEPPPYRRHVSGQAFSVYKGESYYHGKYGTVESRRKYREFIAWWERQETHGPVAVRTLADFAAAFLTHAKAFYVNADGEPTSRYAIYRRYLSDLLERWGDRDVDEIGRDEVKTVQEAWRQHGLCRSTCNQALTTLKAAFRWGADEGLVRPETLASILAVKGLPRGRNLAKEYEPVLPVPDADVEATIAELHAPLNDMVRVQWLAGCRPGELRRFFARLGEVAHRRGNGVPKEFRRQKPVTRKEREDTRAQLRMLGVKIGN
jgi:integrase